ncbi:hypothetical protein IKD67_00895 [Candidatus Saccharibacteria bacterium]|nr:hypothetical protein [Candidatus Saccharibacteria bacterium]
MKKTTKFRVIFGVLALALCLSSCNMLVKAEERSSLGFTVSPANQRILLVPGQKYETSVAVSSPNDSTVDLKYSVSVGSFSLRGSEGGKDIYDGDVDLSTTTSYNQIKDWITLGKDSGTVAPNSTDEVPFTINVPEDAPAGGQYATIIVSDNTEGAGENEEGKSSIKNIMHIASIIYADVAGETREEGAILENNIPSFILNNNLEATSMVRNDGNVHTDASYVLQVWPLFGGEEVCTNEEKPATSLIMPETERYHTESCQLSPIGIFRAKQTVKLFGEESVIEKLVFVCPIWLLFLILFVIAALVIWIVMKIRAGKKNSKKTEE